MINKAKTEMLSAVQRTYKTADGTEKSIYRNIGELHTWSKDDGTSYQTVELYHMPGSKIGVYENKEKPTQAKPQAEEIRVENIPF